MALYPTKDGEVFEVYSMGHIFTGEYPYTENTFGINFWANETGRLKVIYRMGYTAIIREAGHTWRSGLGNFPYAPPKYYVGIFGMGTGHTGRMSKCFIAIYCIEYTRANMKLAKDLAHELAESLNDYPVE
jgi:hypothetical protein